MTDPWYLQAEEYYVAEDQAGMYPPRQGDLFGPVTIHGEQWLACQLTHPTCEIAKKSVSDVHVIRVHGLSEIPDDHKRAAIITGWQEKEGIVRVAEANTYFLAPVPALGAELPLYSNFREIGSVDKRLLLKDATRLAALTHEARITFIRRNIYFRYRLNIPLADVRAMEAARISSDPNFLGPRPAWAPPPTNDQTVPA